MRLRYVLPCAVALFGFSMADAQSVSTSSIPHLEKRGMATQLIVDGRPFLILAGELSNSASSSMEYMAPYWPKLAAANMNTVLAAVTWELVEPEPGKFDFALVDGAIREARRNHLRLIFLWFGSWKNGESNYTPLWVKKNQKQYSLFLAENGQVITYLSVFKEANWKADANAFAALMRHIREVDGDAHTVIMMQVENEVGCPGGTRDQVPEAKTAFDAAVPKQLIDYMAKNKEKLVPEFRQYWEAAGGKTSGTWAEVFGNQPMTNEIFMAWYYAQYVGKVAKAGKAEYPLPMFVNVDLGEVIGQYSGGGALPMQLNVWQQGAPDIDIAAPDIYAPNIAAWCARYDRAGNPLWIPETRAEPSNAFYAIGNHSMGISPFGVERQADATTPLAQAYGLLAQAAPLILEAQAKGTIRGVTLNAEHPTETVQLGNYSLAFSMGRMRQPAPMPAGGNAQPSSYAIVISTGPDDYVILGSGLQATFNGPGPSAAAVATLEEGTYVDGRWVPGRRLNGDDIMLNYDAPNKAVKNESGQGFRLAGGPPKALHLQIYRY
ncbi:MAG: DUF5597 domain-containing protein [Bryobacteraceae bacterium]|jgi:hypothetical protein